MYLIAHSRTITYFLIMDNLYYFCTVLSICESLYQGPRMSTFSNVSFLCAYFNYDTSLNPDNVLSAAGWSRKITDSATIDSYKQFYYPEYIDFMLGNCHKDSARIYDKTIGQSIEVCGVEIMLKNIRLYIMPYGMALYTLHVEMNSDTLNDFTLALFSMREMSRWHTPKVEQFYDKGIRIVSEAAVLLGGEPGKVIEMGNKLKVFQIVNTSDGKNYGKDPDTTLFELGTLGKIGGCSTNDPNSPSRSYIDNVLKKNTLSFFNNWKGLALFDTFTIMAINASSYNLETWTDDYFSIIYIHNLYSKFYLFRLNSDFRLHPESGEDLESEYQEFERQYSFNKISYNFLPGQIDIAIDKALEISEEKHLVANYIRTCNEQKAEETSKRLDRILTFLAIVTVFSTIWDISCMINAMWPFEEHGLTVELGYRLVVLLILLTVILIIFSILRKSKR